MGPESEKVEHHVVVAVIATHADKDYVDLTIATPDGPKTIKATVHHPFYNATTGMWTNAADLETGTLLATPGNGRTSITAIRHYKAETRTYNLTVQSVHTYYVLAGSTPVLVHNTGPFCGVHGGDSGSPTGVGLVAGPAPAKALDMLDKIKNRAGGIGKVPGYQGNGSWGNKLNQLPGGKYREWDVHALVELPSCSVCGRPIRGGERLVTPKSGSGPVYYTPDHYGTFYYVGEYP